MGNLLGDHCLICSILKTTVPFILSVQFLSGRRVNLVPLLSLLARSRCVRVYNLIKLIGMNNNIDNCRTGVLERARLMNGACNNPREKSIRLETFKDLSLALS